MKSLVTNVTFSHNKQAQLIGICTGYYIQWLADKACNKYNMTAIAAFKTTPYHNTYKFPPKPACFSKTPQFTHLPVIKRYTCTYEVWSFSHTFLVHWLLLVFSNNYVNDITLYLHNHIKHFPDLANIPPTCERRHYCSPRFKTFKTGQYLAFLSTSAFSTFYTPQNSFHIFCTPNKSIFFFKLAGSETQHYICNLSSKLLSGLKTNRCFTLPVKIPLIQLHACLRHLT